MNICVVEAKMRPDTDRRGDNHPRLVGCLECSVDDFVEAGYGLVGRDRIKSMRK